MDGWEGEVMAGYDNIKEYGFDKRTADERREIAKRAGVASGEARRRKADFRKTLNTLLTTKIDSEEWTPILESLGLESTLESAVNMAMIKEALAGSVKAYEAIAKYSGQSAQTDADIKEQEIRTDRAKRARDAEAGNTDDQEENIQNFLKAVRPSEEDMTALFTETGEEDNGEEETQDSPV